MYTKDFRTVFIYTRLSDSNDRLVVRQIPDWGREVKERHDDPEGRDYPVLDLSRPTSKSQTTFIKLTLFEYLLVIFTIFLPFLLSFSTIIELYLYTFYVHMKLLLS